MPWHTAQPFVFIIPSYVQYLPIFWAWILSSIYTGWHVKIGNIHVVCRSNSRAVMETISLDDCSAVWSCWMLCFSVELTTIHCTDWRYSFPKLFDCMRHVKHIQGDHLSGKPGNVREFETCQGNVRDVVSCQGSVREKILSWKHVPKLFINYEIIVNLIVWSFTLKLVLHACCEYHLTWAWVPHIVREMSLNFRVSGEWSPCIHFTFLCATVYMPLSGYAVMCTAGVRDNTLLTRSTSSGNVQVLAAGDLSSGHAFNNGCTCQPIDHTLAAGRHVIECHCGAPRLRAQLEFVNALMNVSKRLSQLPTKDTRSESMILHSLIWMMCLHFVQGSYRSGKTGKSQGIWVVREGSGENIFRKSRGKWKIGATRCQIFRLKCIKFDFRWGSAPDPTGGAYSTPQTL